MFAKSTDEKIQAQVGRVQYLYTIEHAVENIAYFS